MTLIEPGAAASGIVERIKNLLLQPSREFERIDQETPRVASLYTGYAFPLALVSAASIALGGFLYGVSFFGFGYRPSLTSAATSAIFYFVWPLVSIWLLSKIIDLLAPTFQGQRSDLKSSQAAIYASTAALLASLFHLLPGLGILALLGFYSYYLLYRALPRLMKTPANQTPGFMAAIIVSSFIVGAIVFSLHGQVQRTIDPAASNPFGRHADPDAKITIPGLGEMRVGDLEQRAKDWKAVAKSIETGTATQSLPVDTLKTLLPQTLPGGFTRASLNTAYGGVMGFSGTTVQASYENGDRRIELSVVDMGAAGAMAGMASAMNMQAGREDETGYYKAGKLDGRMTIEEADFTAKSASYSVVVADRIALSAQGQNVTPDDVKRAISAIGILRTETLLKNAPKG